MADKVINIATDFSSYPGGRYVSDGPYSGQEFRERFLEPVLSGNETCSIVFDGARGYGSSFLEEAFGGLIRIGFSQKEILERFKLIAENDPSLISEVLDYLKVSDGSS